MSDTIGIKDYIQAVNESTARTRSSLYVVILTSVVVFAAAWNSRPGNWIDHRRDKAQRENRLEDVETWGRLTNEDVLLVRPPVLGVTLDVNDLGVLGGFALAFVLVSFSYSLRRELANLKIALARAGEKRDPRLFSEVYDLLSMSQVFTVPPGEGSSLPTLRYLFILPICAQATVLLVDAKSICVGWAESPRDTCIVTLFSLVFLGVIVLVTQRCFKLIRELSDVWADAHKAAQASATRDPQALTPA